MAIAIRAVFLSFLACVTTSLVASPLHDAIFAGDAKKVAALIRSGANVNERDENDFTALCSATRLEQRTNIVEQLLRAKADVNAVCGGRKETALHLAAKASDVGSVKLLLSSGAKVDARNFQDSTPLYIAASGTRPEIVELLLAAGADVNARGVGGNTPLLNAVSNGGAEEGLAIVQLLLRAGADPNASGGYGTPLAAARTWNRTLLIQPLLDATAGDATPGGATPAEAYERLQKAAAARDIVGMAAMLDADNRALLLRDLYLAFAMVNSGEMPGSKADPALGEKLGKLVVGILNPALEKHPLDPVHLRGKSENEQVMIRLSWGLSKAPVSDVLAFARELAGALQSTRHAYATAAIDTFVVQVPKGPLTISKQTDSAAWAQADDRPLGFVKEGGRWFAGGVWFVKVKAAP